MQPGAKPRKKPRQERSLVTYDAILEAATRIFGERGYAGANTNDIAELAGVSIGSLYQYFPNKDALVGALQSHHKREIGAAVKTVLEAAPGKSLRETLAALVSAWFAIHLRDVRFHRRLETDFLPFDRADADDIRMSEAIVNDMIAILEIHQNEVAAPNRTLAALRGRVVWREDPEIGRRVRRRGRNPSSWHPLEIGPACSRRLKTGPMPSTSAFPATMPGCVPTTSTAPTCRRSWRSCTGTA